MREGELERELENSKSITWGYENSKSIAGGI